jgi:hypothetical protein
VFAACSSYERLAQLAAFWDPAAGRRRAHNGHRRIEFRDAEEAGEEDSIIDEVRRLNNDSQLASTVEGTRTRPSALLPRDNTWASDP